MTNYNQVTVATRESAAMTLLSQTPAYADAWSESLAAVSNWRPEAFNTPEGMGPEQMEEARRYFFTAGNKNSRLHL